ncbi:MAG: orotate phosphoribosyltransferase-like protein [Methanosarcina thermophila]|jgi:orotate phosphoribosyltransferase|uniref:Transcriptional regulator GfcR n=3 Tax=Methanosarcina thermophila TaxID=2210 RepID=A0A1I7B6Y6_METTE|nr:orotate phosphoribosyltransferase-like protein [Methanosarcina thermophila]ALK05575.1 MAG: orotate phosphoribosyltransferase [Methanosarcina sp. 795]AKB12979.1 Orotate phosphoribosyltransferase related protein [Methanosarcina thermophila TM-1]AKB16391.1 Orotate phosphoribosyltransferase related protein [Methanosarcina thermophila CHTI-55]NLU56090.1 orotate phosphoribosyltransferase-like protein [Methanosarcina thermophila]SFT82956.1 orotate phosphoribosyltransferase [Methanosarcina thermoph
MKNIEDLIQKAVELQSSGLVTGQIADELNVSRETVTWLLTRSKKEVSAPAPKDISVNWSNIGKSATRLHYISLALCDMVLETLEKTNSEVDVVVGVAASGIPLASMMANELGTDFALYHSRKGQDVVQPGQRGTISRNFGSVAGKNCVIVDDVITTGSTTMEVIEQLREMGAKPRVVVVLVDKKGADMILNVPVQSLVRIVRVD